MLILRVRVLPGDSGIGGEKEQGLCHINAEKINQVNINAEAICDEPY